MSEEMLDFIYFLAMVVIVFVTSYKSYSTGWDEGHKKAKEEETK